eukprot:CAMPEP_0175754248 /NCGR_PEP_ID=MMETSP0097-20121207/62751_1 /TAXON_ID=311494 /ORGANISM="Alexandrium monilatum, Strain CCMP3105" /LENGTH=130 /DNA_ID=CAMNT_0017063195 /DNA_START=26 /DNA_END=414 /DNA_ORIENTATION=+
MTIGGSGRAPLRTSSNNTTIALFMQDVQGPAPTSRTRETPSDGPEEKGGQGQDSLDAFMAGIAEEVSKSWGGDDSAKEKAEWEELQSDDPVVSYYEAFERGERGLIKPRPGKETQAQPDAVEEEEEGGGG